MHLGCPKFCIGNHLRRMQGFVSHSTNTGTEHFQYEPSTEYHKSLQVIIEIELIIKFHLPWSICYLRLMVWSQWMALYSKQLTLNLVTNKQCGLAFHFGLLSIGACQVLTILWLLRPRQQLIGQFRRGSIALRWLNQRVHLRFVQLEHSDLA